MKNSIKKAQSQACLGFAEQKNFRPLAKLKKLSLTLVLLLTAATGAWAQDHEYVDFDLPSGTLWATCNVGADSPEQYGDRYAWGETATKSSYSWGNYTLNVGTGYKNILKYCSDAGWGYNGFTDGLTRLLPEDDAATVNWGKEWRMPTMDDFRELVANTTQESTTIGSIKGMKFISKTDPDVYIFLPYNGQYEGQLFDVNAMGHYWSSDGTHDGGYQFRIQDTNWTDTETGAGRAAGMCIRPVSQPVVYNEARTQATFEMPAFDVTAEYVIVRNMADRVTPQVGDITEEQPRFRVKKKEEGEGYEAVDYTSLEQIAALISVYDAVEKKDLVPQQDFYVKFYKIDEQTLEPIGDGVELADFDFAPGLYAVKAIAQDDSEDYGGETGFSNLFQLVEKVDLTFDPAPVVNMTVTTTEGEADPVEATAEQLEAGKIEQLEPGTEVKLKAKQGYKFIKVVAKEEQ